MKRAFLIGLLLAAAILLSFKGTAQDSDQQKASRVSCLVDSLDRVQPHKLPQVSPVGRPLVIRIDSQQAFDALNDRITQAIHSGATNIQVKLGRGTYHFKNNHIHRKNEVLPDVSISITGKNTVITADDESQQQNGSNPRWKDLVRADTLIRVIDSQRKLCLIPYRNKMSTEERSRLTKVQVTQWYLAPVYDVEKVDENGVYFVAPGLKEVTVSGRKGYNVNNDFQYAGIYPRFRCWDDHELPRSTASCFLRTDGCRYKMMMLKGIPFEGNAGSSALLAMNNTYGEEIGIEQCSFRHIRGRVGSFTHCSNVVFAGNVIRQTSGNELSFTIGCEQVRVTDNRFDECGKDLANTFCVRCNESEYYIADNSLILAMVPSESDCGTGIKGNLLHGASSSITRYISRQIILQNTRNIPLWTEGPSMYGRRMTMPSSDITISTTMREPEAMQACSATMEPATANYTGM